MPCATTEVQITSFWPDHFPPTGFFNQHTAVGFPQQGGPSSAVSLHKAVKIAWRDWGTALPYSRPGTNNATSLYKAVALLSHTTVLLGDPYIVLYYQVIPDIVEEPPSFYNSTINSYIPGTFASYVRIYLPKPHGFCCQKVSFWSRYRVSVFLLFFVIILRRMGKNKAHRTSTYFHTHVCQFNSSAIAFAIQR